MAISSLGVRTTTFTASTTANTEIRTAAADRPRLLEFSYIGSAAAALSIGIGLAQTIGVTPTQSLFQRDDPADPASITQGATAWVTSPTVPLIYARRWNGTNVIGVGTIFAFPRGLVIPVSSSLVCWNITTTIAADVNMILDE